MRKRGIFLIAATVLAVGACGEQGKLQVRSVGSVLAPGVKAVTFRVAEGRAQFALGNVALALESFRKAAREDPSNVEARAGIAACYDRMGRFDLSRRNYEMALAIAPGDPQLLAALAGSLDLQKLAPEAANVRREISIRLAAEAQPAAGADVTPDKVPVATPEAAASERAALLPILPTTVAAAVAALLEGGGEPLEKPRLAAAPPAPRHPEPAIASGPRLERLSLGEVALITGVRPQWKVQQATVTKPTSLTGAAATRHAAATRSGIRLFNAARVDRLASRARSYLSQRGWTVATVGDVVLRRSRSLILYPADKRASAALLSSQFGFAMEQRPGVRQVTILLGHDAAQLPMLRAPSG